MYWVSEAFNTLIIFFALHEIFRTVFSHFYRMRWFRMLFPAVGVFMAIVAVLRSTLRPMPAGSRIYAIIVSLEIGIGFLQIGIFALFLTLGKVFRVRYERHPFGLALGFGLVSSGWFIAYLLRSEFGKQFDPVVRTVTPITYTLGLLVWLITFLGKEQTSAQPGVTIGLTPEQMLSDVKRYTEAAKRIFRH